MKTEEMLRTVLDTNIILSSISRKSPYRIILDKLFEKKIEVYITNEILLEYEEKLIENFDIEVAELTIDALLLLKNVKKIGIYFNFSLIEKDKDDNKFVDCAFAGNVHYLVTNDKHFNILKNIHFPKIKVINIEKFKNIILNL